MSADAITSPTLWAEPELSEQEQPETLYGIYDESEQEFVEAYETAREAEVRAKDRNDLYFNDYDWYPEDEARYTVAVVPRPWPAWCVRA